MTLSAPKQTTFYVAAILWLLALVGAFVPAINGMMTIAGMGAAYWLAIIAGLLLILSVWMEGL